MRAGHPASARIDYAGRFFAPADAPADTEPSSIGHYHQERDLMWAEFRGATIRAGRLVGTVRPDGTIDATYCMVTVEGEALAGVCVSKPTVLPDGRIRLTEHWRRLDGSTGVSQIEELAP
jgi:hypothetical protein